MTARRSNVLAIHRISKLAPTRGAGCMTATSGHARRGAHHSTFFGDARRAHIMCPRQCGFAIRFGRVPNFLVSEIRIYNLRLHEPNPQFHCPNGK